MADPKLVPVLAALIDPANLQVRWMALDALQKINTPEAARAAWPHLAEEADLTRKLRLAEFIGRYGYRGGYPYAIEHLSDPNLRDLAVDALAAIREPRAIPELRDLAAEQRPRLERRRNAGAGPPRPGGHRLAPARVGAGPERPPHGPGAPRTGGPQRVPGAPLDPGRAILAKRRGRDRRDPGARKLLAQAGVRADDVRDELASLLTDIHANQAVRAAALETLVSLDDPRLAAALRAAARDAGLEGSPLLQAVEERLAARKEKLNTQDHGGS